MSPARFALTKKRLSAKKRCKIANASRNNPVKHVEIVQDNLDIFEENVGIPQENVDVQSNLDIFDSSSSCPSISEDIDLDDYINLSEDSYSTISASESEDNFEYINVASEVNNNSTNYHNTIVISGDLGRRVVDMGYVFKQILESEVHPIFGCTILNMEVIHEFTKGLHSNFILKCKMCNITQTITTENPKTEMIDINSSVTLGAMSVGIGYSQCDEFMSSLNIPFMASATFTSKLNEVSDVVRETSWKTMEEAASEERAIAIELGEVDEDGIPYITVIADGAWSKRSYNVNYNASSGVACIIGQRTSKVLFLGIKNKYCAICAKSESRNNAVPKHKCYKNWNKTSTSMESEIILEGFMNSVQLHGLKYLKLVGDGDSSVHKKLLESRPYGEKLVEKIECRNHLLRNFFKKLRELSEKKRSNSKNEGIPPKLRRLLTSNSKRFRTAITKAMHYRIKQDATYQQKIADLKQDILNIPSHVFGEHKKCAELAYFKCSPKENEVNYITDMSKCGLYEDIMASLHRLVNNSASLIYNMDNNVAEHYNSIVCKYVGGKRINFSLGRQYTARCEAAAISVNSAGEFQSVMHKALTAHSPSKYTKKYVNKMLHKRETAKKIRSTKRTKSVKEYAPTDEDYGPSAGYVPPIDLTVEEYEQKKHEFLQKIQKTSEEIVSIERETVGQSNNHLWKQERRYRLTASNFGDICKMRINTSCVKKVEAILYSTFYGNKHTKYGIESEPFAIAQFENDFNKIVTHCGLYIDKKYGYLAASPDGIIVEDEALIEVKCPSTAKNMHPRDAIVKGIVKFATVDNDGCLILKRNHNYYHQIQGQLHIANMKVCYFIVWTPLGIMVEKIASDSLFWENKMLQQLQHFYMNCLLPEIIDPRKPRKLPIRNLK